MLAAPLRLRRIVDAPSEKAILLSFTSSMQLGRIPGAEDAASMIGMLATRGLMTAAIVHAGILDSLFARFPDLRCGTIVDLFGGTWLHATSDEQICSIKHAVRVGADAVLSTISLGTAGESRRLRLTGEISRECKSWGLPLVVRIDTSQTDARRQFSATLAGQGSRLAYELGADLVVVNYSGNRETFSEAIRGIDIPVLVGGSPQMHNDEAMLGSIREAVACGVEGVCLPGEFFWRDAGPAEVLQRLKDELIGS